MSPLSFADKEWFAHRAAGLIVVHLRKEITSAFGCHVEESPERVDKIAGAMVLLGNRRSKAHLGAPEVADRAVLLPEDIEDCFVPIFAVRNSILRAHSLGKFRRVTKVVRVILVACGRQ
jgi:hypothetical protein